MRRLYYYSTFVGIFYNRCILLKDNLKVSTRVMMDSNLQYTYLNNFNHVLVDKYFMGLFPE